MMTLHEITTTASAQLQHWAELHGLGANPIPAIRRIAGEVTLAKPQVRDEVELHLHDEWALLCALEGDDQ